MSISVAEFNEILWSAQLTKKCVDCSEENIIRVLRDKHTSGHLRRKLKMLMRRFSHLHIDEFLSDAEHYGMTWEQLAQLIPNIEERRLFLTAHNESSCALSKRILGN
jgi:putative lipase involved disintegration of autophagic bodies